MDDQALYVDSPRGLIIVMGCAHAGVVNTLEYVSELTGRKTFHAVIGGMHLLRCSPERFADCAAGSVFVFDTPD